MTVRGAKYERRALDNYPTPPEAAHALFRNVKIGPGIWEPACGKKRNIMEAAKECGLSARGDDIIFGYDFLEDRRNCMRDVVTNPPFGVQGRLAMQFIEHALLVTKGWERKVAMLLPVDFDSAKTRSHVFYHPAFDCKLVLTDRIKWFNNKSGSINHAWFVWDHKRRVGTPPTIRYARVYL